MKGGATGHEPRAGGEVRQDPVLPVEGIVDLHLVSQLRRHEKHRDLAIRHDHGCQEVQEGLPIADRNRAQEAF